MYTQYIIITVHSLTEDEIRWVITIPVIWPDNSKQFMKQAAEQVTTDMRSMLWHQSNSLSKKLASLHIKLKPL